MLAVGHGLECLVDDVEQLRVVTAYGKAETMGFVFAEVGHFDVLQIPLVDHVMGRHRVPQKHIGLIECHGINSVLIRGVGLNDRIGVKRLDLIQWQVVVNHA